ncbi:MAG: glycosyltransferase [Terriglobia bacterium]|nr:glycosyltransferase [Terriglobia bacterium]
MPKVSVLVPNYNYERFLSLRLQSIADQTYRDFEVILLDDASTDKSPEIMRQFAARYGWLLAPNTSNSGSVFKQWNKGLKLARGEYVWIAESDDYADPRFLETLVPVLENNPKCGIVYCESLKIDAGGNPMGEVRPTAFGTRSERWNHDFTASGQDEISNFFIQESTIPNASAVLFRRKFYEIAGGIDESFRLSADYKFWASILATSDLSYIATPLNFFRSHGATTRSKTRAWEHLAEMLRVMQFMAGRTSVPNEAMQDLHGRIGILFLYAFLSERPTWPKLKESWRLARGLGFRPSVRALSGMAAHIGRGIRSRIKPKS